MASFDTAPLSGVYVNFSCPELIEIIMGLGQRYPEAVDLEIKKFCLNRVSQKPLESVFIGGFRPNDAALARLLDTSDTLRSTFGFDEATEITVEIQDPNTLADAGILDQLKAAGVNRVSIKIYFPKDVTLQPSQRKTKYDMSRLGAVIRHASAWFENINVDICITDPSKVSAAHCYNFMEKVVTWPVSHVSVYEGSEQSYEQFADVFAWCRDVLCAHGFDQYEFLHFSRNGHEFKGNKVVWDRKAYKGFGWGASSFDGESRMVNESLIKYIERIELGEDPAKTNEKLTPEQMHLEKLMVGLRRKSGIAMQSLLEDLDVNKQENLKNNVSELVNHGLIAHVDERLMFTHNGMLVENQVISKLLV